MRPLTCCTLSPHERTPRARAERLANPGGYDAAKWFQRSWSGSALPEQQQAWVKSTKASLDKLATAA